MADTLNDLLIELQDLVAKLETLGFGNETESVTHNSVTRPSLQKVIEDKYSELQSLIQGRVPFETKADMVAAGAPANDVNGNLPLADVWNDPDNTQNGIYGWNGSAWIKSNYDVIEELRAKSRPKYPNKLRNGNKPLLVPFASSNFNSEATTLDEFNRYGVYDVMRVEPGGSNSFFVRDPLDGSANGQHCVASMLVYSATASFPDVNIGFEQDAAYVKQAGKFIQLTPELRLFYSEFQMPVTGALDLVVGYTNSAAATDVFFTSGWAYALSSVALNVSDLAWNDFGGYQNIELLSDRVVSEIGRVDLDAAAQKTEINEGLASKVGVNIYPPVNRNAVIGRYQEAVNGSRFSGIGNNQLTREINTVAGARFGDIRVTVNNDTVNSYNLRTAALITPQDLATIGVVPDDAVPPLVSMKASFIKELTLNTGIDLDLQIWFMLRYGSPLAPDYVEANNVLLKNESSVATFLGAGDAQFNHVANTFDDADALGWTHEGVPVPATYGGLPFTGIVLLAFGYSDDVLAQRMALGNVAVIAGSAIDYAKAYRNSPEDEEQMFVVKEVMLDAALKAKVNSVGSMGFSDSIKHRVSIKDSDKITVLGDSYSESLYTPKDKAYISILSSLMDWRFENFSVSGDDLLEINKRVLDNSPKYHASLGVQDYGGTYGLIISYANDYAYRSVDLDHYFDNTERLVQSVRAVGMEPIIASEWVGSAVDLSGLKSVADRNGIAFFNVYDEALNFRGSAQHLPFWGQGHPGVRTNSLLWGSLLKQFKGLSRPQKGLKIYRPRPGYTINVSQDLVYNSVSQRLDRWKEITIGHRALLEEEFYDALDQSYGTVTINSEYLALQSNEPVAFSDYALVEVIVPTTANKLAAFDLLLSDTTVNVYALDHLVDPGFDAYNSTKPVPGYTDNVFKPRGAWAALPLVGDKFSFAADKAHNYVNYDKIILLIEKAGTFNLSDIYVDWVGEVGKLDRVEEVFTPVPRGEEMLAQPLVGDAGQLAAWNKTAGIAVIALDDSDLPRKCLGVIEVTDTESIDQNFTTVEPSNAYSSDGCVTIWARSYPAKFAPVAANYPALAPVTGDTVDFKKLKVSIGHSGVAHVTDHVCLVGIGWHEIRLPLSLASDISGGIYNIKLASVDGTPIQIAKVSVRRV